jgi:lysyl endopeptidase
MFLNTISRLLFVYIMLLSSLFRVQAQTKDFGKPLTISGKVKRTTVFYETPMVDTAIEATLNASNGEKMLRFGKEFEVDLNLVQLAKTLVLPSGSIHYQFGISCPNALSINLIFSKFRLAAGTHLYISDALSKQFIGAYTSFNNNSSAILGTELIHSSKIIVEWVEHSDQIGSTRLTLGTIIHGYKDLNSMAKSLSSSGNCHYDVNCPAGINWANQRNSVAMMVNGGGFCTGSLVNNTSGNVIPYFLSANHCGTNPAGWVFRFRWERPEGHTVCGSGSDTTNGPEFMNINGGILRASWVGSDFTLTELNNLPDPAWGIYYSGWDNTNSPVSSAVGIHHPAGDIKKISIEDDPLTNGSWTGTPSNSHWHVPHWDLGVTEGGSSGSPLFDQNHHLIGQLHGGSSSCGGTDLSDDYGKFAFSWLGNNTTDTQLKYWLDPTNTGATVIEGYNPLVPSDTLDAALNNLQGTSGVICNAGVSASLILTNAGTDSLFSVVIHYGYDGILDQTLNWSGSLAQWQNAVINFPESFLTAGNHTFHATLTNPNDYIDQNAGNDSLASTFQIVINGQSVDLNLQLDCWGSETSWELLDSSNTILYSGSGYADANELFVQETFCLAAGCYAFKIMDEFGDGMSGCTGQSAINGSYAISNDSIILCQILPEQANFGTSNTQTFCIKQNSIDEPLSLPVLIYPNPAYDMLTVISDGINMQQIKITNLAGQIIQEKNVYNEQITIDVSVLSRGIYFIHVLTEKGSALKKLILK